MKKEYYEISVKINPSAIELVTDVFFENFECEGVVQAEEKWKDLELVETTDNLAKGYVLFEEPEVKRKDIQSVFDNAKQTYIERGLSEEELGTWEVGVRNIINEDWSKKWKEHWKPLYAGEHVIICPSWEECTPKRGEILINLDPGSAFGTGTHATTQLCIRAIEKYMQKNAVAADIGTGSGILAITAVKCGAKKAIGIDNDPDVIDVARDNAQINRVLDKTEFFNKTADELNEEFDFVAANILHNVLAQIMGDLKKIMKKGAHMVLSGILDEKQQIVLDAVKKHDLETVEILKQENWAAIVVKKNV